MRFVGIIGGILCWVSLAAGVVQAQQNAYTITPLPAGSEVLALNDMGMVLYSSDGEYFLFAYNQSKQLNMPEGYHAETINNFGDVLAVEPDSQVSVLYRQGETIQIQFRGFDLNNTGEVLGFTHSEDGRVYYKYIVDANEYIPLAHFDPYPCFNDQGIVAGTIDDYPYIWDGELKPLGLYLKPAPARPPYNTYYKVIYIADDGVVYGETEINNPIGITACMWDTEGNISLLPVYGSIRAANDQGDFLTDRQMYKGDTLLTIRDLEFINQGLCERLRFIWQMNNNRQLIIKGASPNGPTEFLATPTKTSHPEDINGDRCIDFHDVAAVCSHWLDYYPSVEEIDKGQVQIVSPYQDQSFPAVEPVLIEVNTIGEFVKIEFSVNGEIVGEDTDPSDGWSFIWSPPADAMGLQAIRVVGTSVYCTTTEDDVTIEFPYRSPR